MNEVEKLMKKDRIILDIENSFIQQFFLISDYKIKIFLIIIFILSYFYSEKNYNMKEFNINKYKPKISIFLPIYNKEKYLKRSIGSIQKQSLKELEIIAVNDGSTDNSLNILQNLSQKDSRIKIVNNHKNRGLLYSRAMGILNSNGEYLMNLDPDDEFNGSKYLKNLYLKAKRLNVDMISFIMLYLPDKIKCGESFIKNKILYQPELYESAFLENNLKDYYITNKLIKKELLKNIYKIFEKKINGDKWNYHEDNIWSILIHKYANSSINLNKIIYYYYKNNDSEMMNKGNDLELKNLLYRYDMYKEIFNVKNEVKYIIAGFKELLYKIAENINIIRNNNKTLNKFFNITKEMMNNYDLSHEILNKTKNIIKNLTSKL